MIKKTHWYGWQTLLGLAVTDILLMGGGIAARESVPVLIGYLARPLVPPVIHWAHGHVGKGFGSLGLNVGGPLTLGLIGSLISQAGSDGRCGMFGCGTPGLAAGLLIGGLAAPIIDVAVLSNEEVLVPAEPDGTKPPSVMLVPIFSVGHVGRGGREGRGGLALAGQF